nr:fha domain-containing protein [Quercus suber]
MLVSLCLDSDISSNHLDSSNGTILNGTKLQLNIPHDLSDGNSFKIGEYTSILVNIISSHDESQLRQNPRHRATQTVSMEQVSEIRGQSGRVLKEAEEAEKGEVLNTRNQMRDPLRKAKGLKSYEDGVDRARIL